MLLWKNLYQGRTLLVFRLVAYSVGKSVPHGLPQHLDVRVETLRNGHYAIFQYEDTFQTGSLVVTLQSEGNFYTDSSDAEL
ncbi:MAG: hypothetical protein ABSA92_12240 [Candidatus Bathyarchaeia archaeon]|jgi:hypothetical protein